MKTGRPRNSQVAARRGIRGEWEDVDEGACQRCGTERRLYQPVEASWIRVCAPCAAPTAVAGTPNTPPSNGVAHGTLDALEGFDVDDDVDD